MHVTSHALKIWSWNNNQKGATLNMSGGVIKQRAATNRGWCVFSFVDSLVIYNTGGPGRTGPAMLNSVQARVVKHVG